MTSNFKFRPGYYYRNGKWYPSKKTKKKNQQNRLHKQISYEISLNPEKYPGDSFVTSRKAAIYYKMDIWWSKCTKGHLTARKVTETRCPICIHATRTLRDKRIKDSLTNVSPEELKQISYIYAEARHLTKTTGIDHHVDHIRPLAAGGLHHPNNLQILKAEDNLSKGSEFLGAKRTYSKKEKKEVRKKLEDEIKNEREKAIKEKEKELKVKRVENQKEGLIDLLITIISGGVVIFIIFYFIKFFSFIINFF